METTAIFYLIDLFGTFAFATTGALKAIKHDLDIVGILFLSTLTGIGGGTIRDVLLGKVPPFPFVDPAYIIITTLTGLGVFFLHSHVGKKWNLFLRFDAIGLGAFSVIGASIAYSSGLGFVGAITAGILTAVGGGIMRDFLVNEVPLVFSKEVYAFASFIGALIFYALITANFHMDIAMIIGMIATIFIRILSIQRNLNLPKARK